MFASPKVFIVSSSVFNVTTSKELEMLELEARQIQFHEQMFLGIFLVLGRKKHISKFSGSFRCGMDYPRGQWVSV